MTPTFAPAPALRGEILAIAGTGADTGRKPYLAMIAWPFVLRISSM